MAITIPVFQYQQKAEVPQTSAAPVVPDQPWLLLDPPTRRRHQVPGEGVLPPSIALPYDLPLLDASPVVMRRVEPRREGFAQPVAPLPFDLPLLDPAPAVVRRVDMRREGYASPVAPLPYDLPLTAPPDVMRARTRVWGDGSPEFGRADVVVVPDLVALSLVSPLPRPRRFIDPVGGSVPILDAQPFPGDLATTIVQGTLPCAILSSGMTPGDDADG